jgi:hypothetical protein
MNTFSRFGSQLFRKKGGAAGSNSNSLSYIDKQNLYLTLDPSGTDYIDYSNNNIYYDEAYSINPNNENTTLLTLNQNNAPVFLSSLSNFTIAIKYKINDFSDNLPFLGQIYNNPVYDISFSDTAIFTGDSFQVTIVKGSDPVNYIISGDLTSTNINNAPLTGVLNEIESILTYNVTSGSGIFQFTIENTDVSGSIVISKNIWIKVQTNVLGEPVFAFSETGVNGLYYNQMNISFLAGNSYRLDVSDTTNASYNFVASTSPTDSPNTSVLSNNNVNPGTNGAYLYLEIPNDYSGDALHYFDASNSNMGLEQTFYSLTLPNENIYYNNTSWNNTYGHSQFDLSFALSASSLGANNNTLEYLFSNTIGTEGADSVVLGSSAYYSVNPVGYSGPSATITTNLLTISGEWVQWEFPYKTRLRSIRLNQGYESIVSSTYITQLSNTWPQMVCLLGSNDGTAWDYLDSIDTNVSASAISNSGLPSAVSSGYGDLTIQNEAYYTYYRMVVETLVNDNGATITNSNTQSPRIGHIHLSCDIHTDVSAEIHYVNVYNDLFYVDGLVVPDLSFASGTTYLFDQSDSTNIGNTFVLGTVMDSSSSMINYQNVIGTPGLSGAYSSFSATSESVYYFSYESSNMTSSYSGYSVKVVSNVLGQPVFAIKSPSDNVYYNQPDISFGAGDSYEIDISHPSMKGYKMVFGTSVDVSSSIVTSVFSADTKRIYLDISAAYSGDGLVYFDENVSGMGYNVYVTENSFGTLTFDFETDEEGWYNVYNNNAADNSDEIWSRQDNSYESQINAHSGSFYIGPTRKWADYRDSAHSVMIFRSPNIELLSNYDISAYFTASKRRQDSSTSWDVIPEGTTATSNGGVMCLALRRASDLNGVGKYIADIGRTNEDQNNWQQASMNSSNIYSDTSFNQSELYTLDLVDQHSQSWGWMGMDYVVITNARLADSNFVIYNVTVSNEAFYIQDDTSTTEKPNLTFTDGTLYIFIQSDSSNANNQLVLGTTSDDNSSMINYQTIVGTPGRPGAYTSFTATSETVSYFSFETLGMGYEPPVIYTFTNADTPETLTITSTKNIQYVLVAGGGSGGGGAWDGGGGGAGGVLHGTIENVQPGDYTVTIGKGGVYVDNDSNLSDGDDTTITLINNTGNVTLTAIGGGGGGNGNGTGGSDGGSGGGNSHNGSNGVGSGTSGQGNDGGIGGNTGAYHCGGGGGGASVAGTAWGYTDGDGNGGDGVNVKDLISVYPTDLYIGGGGGGSVGMTNTSQTAPSALACIGGLGGGGNGYVQLQRSSADSGINGTGGGGGGIRGDQGDPGSGGSGIAIFYLF